MRDGLTLSGWAVVWRARWPTYGGCPATGEKHQMERVGKSMWGCHDCPGWFEDDETPAIIAAGERGHAIYDGRPN